MLNKYLILRHVEIKIPNVLFVNDPQDQDEREVEMETF